MHYRVCRDCGEEFRPDIAQCSDCGGKLEDKYEDESAPPTPRPAQAPEDQEPIESLVELLLASNANDLVPAAERLRREDVEFWLRQAVVDRESGLTRYVLAVRADDRRRAAEVLRPVLDRGLPVDILPGAEGEVESGPAYSACPACGSALVTGALECPECGLILGESTPEGAVCPACGERTPPGAAGCPSCGLG